MHRTIDPSVLYLGTPVYLVVTENSDGTANLAPASSHYALGKTLVLGLEQGGQSLDNLRENPELTVNFLEASQWVHAERLAGVTGKNPVPPAKAGNYVFEPHKFERARLTPGKSYLVGVPVVAEAPVQIEAKVLTITPSSDGVFAMVEAAVLRVHAREDITVPETNHLDPHAWHPLIYVYRHFFDRGEEVGWTRKSPLAQLPEQVEKWQKSGGAWQVLDVSETSAAVALLDGAGAKTVEVLNSNEPAFIRWAQVASASLD